MYVSSFVQQVARNTSVGKATKATKFDSPAHLSSTGSSMPKGGRGRTGTVSFWATDDVEGPIKVLKPD